MTYRDVKLTLTLRNPESLTDAQRNALIDAAVAAVCIDGVLSPAETEMAGSLLASALSLEPAASLSALRERLEVTARALRDEGIEAVARGVGAALTDPAQRNVAFLYAAALACIDGVLTDQEAHYLSALRAALELTEAEAYRSVSQGGYLSFIGRHKEGATQPIP